MNTLTHDQIFADIFQRQTNLFHKYQPIYANRGFYYPPYNAFQNPSTGNVELLTLPNINDPHFQLWVKSKLWCAVEEISEMQVELIKTPIDTNKVCEELIDVLHFQTEISLVLGYKSVPQMLQRGKGKTFISDRIDGEIRQYLYSLGQLGHTLRNKPWKQTSVDTNIEEMKVKLMFCWANLMGIFQAVGMTLDHVYSSYVAKHEINQQRQKEKY